MISVLANEFGITYDPVRQVLSISRGKAGGQSQELLTITLQTLRDQKWQGASRWVGEAILLLIPETRVAFLPETKDDESPSAFLDRAIAELANRGDAPSDDLYMLSMLHLVRARLMKSLIDLRQADKFLRQAAAAGNSAAARAIRNSWAAAMGNVEKEISAK
jgi:hypothetical protein